MASITSDRPTIVNVATRLAEQVAAGTPARATLGDRTAAFAWSTGLPRGLWSFTRTVMVAGPSFTALKVSPSGTPVAVVAEGALKPTAVALTSETVSLQKYAGLGVASLEQTAYSDALPAAILSTLVAGGLVALEEDLVALALADAGTELTGATSWPAAVVDGLAAVAGKGGRPNLLVMSPADFAAAIETPSSLVFTGTDDVPTYLGLQLHVSHAMTPGSALVMDSGAMTVGESVESPSVVLDPYSMADVNKTRIVVDLMAAGCVTAPAAVVKITPTITP